MPLPSCRLCAHVTKEPHSIAGYSGFSKEVGNLYFGVKSSNQKLLTHHFKGQQTINKTHLCAGSIDYSSSLMPHFPTFLWWNVSILVLGERETEKSFCLSEKRKDGLSMETGTAERKEHSLWNRVLLKSQIFLLALDFRHRAVFLVELDSLGNWPWKCDLCVGGVRRSALGSTVGGAAGRLGRGYGDTSGLSWLHAELWTGNGSREMSPVKSRGPGLYTLTLRSHRWGATLEEGKVVPFQLQQEVKTLWELTEMGWGGKWGKIQEGRDICISSAGSCWWMAKPITIL